MTVASGTVPLRGAHVVLLRSNQRPSVPKSTTTSASPLPSTSAMSMVSASLLVLRLQAVLFSHTHRPRLAPKSTTTSS